MASNSRPASPEIRAPDAQSSPLGMSATIITPEAGSPDGQTRGADGEASGTRSLSASQARNNGNWLGKAGSASELAELVGVERSTLARNLERLVSAGLVSTLTGEGRRVRHELTPAGEQKIDAALPLWREAQQALVNGLPEGKAPTLHEELALLRKAARAAQH